VPMRAIVKKRCRAIVEPPEKGERDTLNPNLSTRQKTIFFRTSSDRIHESSLARAPAWRPLEACGTSVRYFDVCDTRIGFRPDNQAYYQTIAAPGSSSRSRQTRSS
jgi:hypothetical protein